MTEFQQQFIFVESKNHLGWKTPLRPVKRIVETGAEQCGAIEGWHVSGHISCAWQHGHISAPSSGGTVQSPGYAENTGCSPLEFPFPV